HTEQDLEALREAVRASLEALGEGGFLPRGEPAQPPRPQVARAAVLSIPQPRPSALLRLLCLPYAGAGTSSYRQWGEALPEEVELGLVQLPGRDGRSGEPAYRDFDSLVELLVHELLPHLDRPFAFFGHSMGALLAFELSRRLQARGLRSELLLVSGEPAPHLPRPQAAAHELDDAALARALVRYGLSEELTRQPEFIQGSLPLLRADLAVCDSYRYQPGEPVDCDLVALGGREDPLASRSELSAWAEHTASDFSQRMFAGNHFFLHGARRSFLLALRRELVECVERLRLVPPEEAAHAERRRQGAES
ncbi:MAG TPA: alpha/beta fold hydrolase, partial [Myxococcaceae bacterium]|nr:alpha/beta fold hydrolase [Myxococcaceae bacterium]